MTPLSEIIGASMDDNGALESVRIESDLLGALSTHSQYACLPNQLDAIVVNGSLCIALTISLEIA
jgi:hypothetical protein